MATRRRSESEESSSVVYPMGQQLHCQTCGSAIEVISPCTCQEAHQVFECCGEEMQPSTGRDVSLGVL